MPSLLVSTLISFSSSLSRLLIAARLIYITLNLTLFLHIFEQLITDYLIKLKLLSLGFKAISVMAQIPMTASSSCSHMQVDSTAQMVHFQMLDRHRPCIVTLDLHPSFLLRRVPSWPSWVLRKSS